MRRTCSGDGRRGCLSRRSLQPPEAGKAGKQIGLFPRASRKDRTLVIPWSQPSEHVHLLIYRRKDETSALFQATKFEALCQRGSRTRIHSPPQFQQASSESRRQLALMEGLARAAFVLSIYVQ